jgi:hypothetical protein
MSTAKAGFRRTAHPYRDTAVIDRNAPRTNQVVTGVVTLAAVLTGWEWLVGLMALQLFVGLSFGRRYCLPCLFYFEVLQPRLGEGALEDARPPRFANLMAVTFTGLATVLFLVGLGTAGWVLTGMVSAMALFSGATGFCVGCWIHRRVYGRCDACDVPVAGRGA